jgi:SAM-dependent MidA family methyltransferase
MFARDFLAACRTLSPSLADRIRYVIVERSPAMQASQRRVLEPSGLETGRMTWLSRLSELGEESVVGALFSNELVDAFPVHRIGVMNGTAREVFVDYVGGRFCEQWQPLSSPGLQTYLDRLAALGIVLPEGARADVNLQAVHWMEDVARVLDRGFVVTVDYGHLAHDLYGPDRRGGTLLCYYHHMASDNPYERVGLQDMTAHVDFSMLACAGRESGLQVTGFTNQMSFLIGLGVERLLESMEPGSAAFQSVVQLLRPDGMGGTFEILIQHKGVEGHALDGLTFKPFFGAGLTDRLAI